MSAYSKYSSDNDDYDDYAEEHKNYQSQLVLHMSKIFLILAALVWGFFLLINSVPALGDAELSLRRGLLRSTRMTQNGLLKVSVEAVKNETFRPAMQNIQWLEGAASSKEDNGLFLVRNGSTYLIRSAFDETFSHTLVNFSEFTFAGENYKVDSVAFSPDVSHGIIKCNTVANWRHSSFATYFLYSIEGQKFYRIGDNVALAKWSPDSQSIAFVMENDIYLFSVWHLAIERVTYDGSETIFNGRPDWVYEEEILEDNVALWWSPNGSHLAYFKTNDDSVHDYPIPYYVENDSSLYPKMLTTKYPKAGTTNPLVTLNIYDTRTHGSSVIDFKDSNFLITDVTWVGETDILTKVSDRTGQYVSTILARASTGHLLTTRSDTINYGWFEPTQDVMFIPKSEQFDRLNNGYIDVVSVDGYRHLVYYSPADNSEPIVLTSGEWEVVGRPYAFDPETNDIYFGATMRSSTDRHIYAVNLLHPGTIRSVTDSSKPGVYSAQFSSSARFMLLNYLGPDVPHQRILDMKPPSEDGALGFSARGETLYYLEENTGLQEALKKYSFNRPTYRELPVAENAAKQEILVNTMEILPPDFNLKRTTPYPVLFCPYGGPNSQQVIKTFSVGMLQALSAQLDAIIVVADGRGTGFKGDTFRHAVHGNLGHLEAADQISIAKLYSQLPYVDSNKIGMFGWSFGGYLTLKTLEQDAGNLFKFGMAVAPVTDWALYDSVYTERYMSTPELNPEGYAASKVHNITALASVPRFLLVHGTGDDNVHFQHTLKLMDQLNLAGASNYDIRIYPDSRHHISFHNADNLVYQYLIRWANQAISGTST